jgi:hypothetical protein
MNTQKSSTEINRKTFSDELGNWTRSAFQVGGEIKNWFLAAPRVWLTILAVFLASALFGNKPATLVFNFFFSWGFLAILVLGLLYAPALLGAAAGKIVGGIIRWFKCQLHGN